MNPVTGSKTDPYKYKYKQNSKITLSPLSEIEAVQPTEVESGERVLPGKLKTYFENLTFERKRKSEWSYFQELRLKFSDTDLADALESLIVNGLPGSEEFCHSPMAFLASGGAQRVIQEIRAQTERDVEMRRNKECLEAMLVQNQMQEIADERETRVREQAFDQAFATEEARKKWMESLAFQFPTFEPNGVALRNLAVSKWWEERHGLTQNYGT